MGVLVSVVMLVFNAVAYVEAAVSSLRRQSLVSLKIIVEDDGATDRSGEIEQANAHSGIRYLRLARKLGYGAAMKRGVEEARGRFIGRADADDISHRLRLQRHVRFLVEHPEIAFVWRRRWLISRGGRRLGISLWSDSGEPWSEEREVRAVSRFLCGLSPLFTRCNGDASAGTRRSFTWPVAFHRWPAGWEYIANMLKMEAMDFCSPMSKSFKPSWGYFAIELSRELWECVPGNGCKSIWLCRSSLVIGESFLRT